jgi:tRNA threonylcarbamoyl adenosine modification protein (Sua5/YciO/YrdC/YwlC family)
LAAELIEIFPENIDERKLKKVIECLQDGGLLIYPTDTVYSMGCDSNNVKAVERLCKLKGVKPTQNKFSIVCNDLSNIAKYAKVSNVAFRILKKYLPGPFTFILPATSDLPKIMQTNRKTIGIRIPNHMIPLKIIDSLGNPIITTSVKNDIDDINEYPNQIEDIWDLNKDDVDIIIDGGWCDIYPSTVIDGTTDNFELIRNGIGIWNED